MLTTISEIMLARYTPHCGLASLIHACHVCRVYQSKSVRDAENTKTSASPKGGKNPMAKSMRQRVFYDAIGAVKVWMQFFLLT